MRWLHEHCSNLKQGPKAVGWLIDEVATLRRRTLRPQALRDGAYSAWTFALLAAHQMKCSVNPVDQHLYADNGKNQTHDAGNDV